VGTRTVVARGRVGRRVGEWQRRVGPGEGDSTAAGVFAAGQSWTSWSRPDAPSTTSWGASVVPYAMGARGVHSIANARCKRGVCNASAPKPGNLRNHKYSTRPSRPERWPSRPERWPSRPERWPSRPERWPSRPERWPSRPERWPSRPERWPSRPERWPSRPERWPSRPERWPSRAERWPSRAEKWPSRAEKWPSRRARVAQSGRFGAEWALRWADTGATRTHRGRLEGPTDWAHAGPTRSAASGGTGGRLAAGRVATRCGESPGPGPTRRSEWELATTVRAATSCAAPS